MLKKITVACFLGFLVFCIAGCGERERPLRVSFDKKVNFDKGDKFSARKMLRIGIAEMVTVKQNYDYYLDLVAYMGDKLNTEVLIVSKENYNEINSLINNGEIDAAFISSGSYVEGRDSFGLEPIAMPQISGRADCRVYIIVPADSQAKNLKDLKGKIFGFSSPSSNVGRFVPGNLLVQMGESPESFFKKYVYTHGQDISIKAVAEKKLDGASVSSHIWEYIKSKDPALVSKVRVIFESDPYASFPFVVRSGLFPELKESLKRVLLEMDKDPEGRRILNRLMIDKFVEAHDSAYDGIRAIRSRASYDKVDKR